MKNHKKILAVSLPVLLLFSMISLLLPTKAEAYVATSAAQIQNATFEFVNRGLIKVKIGEKTIDFVDTKPFDYGLKYIAQDYECDSYIGGEEKMNEKFALTSLGNYPGSLNTDWIHIKYNDGKGNGCQEVKISKWPGGVDVGMRTWFNWVDAGAIEIVDGSRRFTKTGSNDYFLYTGESGENCQDRVFLNTSTTRAGDNTPSQVVLNSGKYFELDKDGELDPSKTDAKGLNLGNDCEITGYNFLPDISGEKAFNNFYKTSFTLGAVQNRDKPAGEGTFSNGQKSDATTGGGDSESGDACEQKAFALNWVFCPMIGIIDDIFTKINDEVEKRLTVNTNNFQGEEIKKTWSIFRVIATSVLVIIMLVMVISQAIGTNVFEAYTVRKILPRLVVAAILIQLSLSMFLWVITLANNAGNGIFDLIAIPFGGRQQLGLEHLIGRLGESVPGGSIAAALFGAAGILIFNPFLVLLVMFMIFMAVLTAAAVLLFREILILACVILGPLALLAWILPGTNRYWKMWWENFSKALLIFPLIMALIAVGRVFAWVIGSNEGTPGIFDWFGVLIAFFLPYYLLPKTFKWGGSLMASAGNAINGAMKPISNFGNKEIRDMGQRYQGKRANDYNPDKSVSVLKRGLRRFQSGHAIPLSKRSQMLAIQKGEKWSGERNEEAYSISNRRYNKALSEGYTNKAGKSFTPGVAAAKAVLADMARDEDYRIAEGAIKKLIDTASWPEIQALEDSQGRKVFEQNPHWEKTLAKSPEHYPRVLRSRVDAASHVIQSAEGATYDKVINQETGETVMDLLGVNPADRARLSGQGLSFEHQRVYRTWYAIANQMGNEDFQTQSEGFWNDANEFSKLDGGEAITKALRDRFNSISQAGPTAAQQNLGHLVGGSVQSYVDGILGSESVTDYLDRARGAPTPIPTTTASANAGGTTQTSSSRPAQPGPGSVWSPSGVSIPHDSPTGQVIEGTDFEIQSMAQRAGGWNKLSNTDLVRIYNYRSGELKEQAAVELRNRGLMQ